LANQTAGLMNQLLVKAIKQTANASILCECDADKREGTVEREGALEFPPSEAIATTETAEIMD